MIAENIHQKVGRRDEAIGQSDGRLGGPPLPQVLVTLPIVIIEYDFFAAETADEQRGHCP